MHFEFLLQFGWYDENRSHLKWDCMAWHFIAWDGEYSFGWYASN